MLTKIVKASELEAEYQSRTCKAGDLHKVFVLEEAATFPGMDMDKCRAAGSELRRTINGAVEESGTNELCMMLPPIF